MDTVCLLAVETPGPSKTKNEKADCLIAVRESTDKLDKSNGIIEVQALLLGRCLSTQQPQHTSKWVSNTLNTGEC